MNCSNSCNSKARLLSEINEVSFAVNDMLLFLDTHPCDEKALDFFNEMAARRRRLMLEYAKAFGPLTVDDAIESGGDTWKWMEQPFPWEKKGA